MLKKLAGVLLLFIFKMNAQEVPIKVLIEEIPNRLAFYAVNENDEDYDVLLNISGSNFRQSQTKPRLVRVPGASKVHLKTIILIRNKRPNFIYDIEVNDSLSRRALRKEYTPIKVKPKKSITVYITEACNSCDSIVGQLEESKFIFNAHRLSERPEIKEQLKSSFPTTIDTISAPIFNLGGLLYTRIENYDQLLSELNKE